MMPYSAKLQAFVETLLARHSTSKEMNLQLILGETEIVVISQTADHRQVRLNHFIVMYQGRLVKDLEIAFFVDDEGHWIPYVYYRPPTDHRICGAIDTRYPKLVIENPWYQRAVASQCDLWAIRLRNQAWLEEGKLLSSVGMEFEGELLWPTPTVDEPDGEQLEQWIMAGVCEATDGCMVKLDETCSHGHPSWLLRMGWR